MASSREIRRAIVQARHTQNMSGFLVLEFMVIGLLVGVSSSAQAGIITFFVLLFGLFIPVVGVVIVVVLGGIWAAMSFAMAYEAFGLVGGIVIGGFGAMMAMGLHLGGLTGARDA